MFQRPEVVWLNSGLGVDETGNVYGPDGARRTQYFDGTYPKVSLKRKTYKVHRLMAEAYLGQLDLTVNHIDGNRCNNRLDNLEMVSLLDNLRHAFDNGLHCNPERPVRATHSKTGHTAEFPSVMEAVRSIPKAHNANIYRSIREPHRMCAGYYWEYV
jgi:hypothetical protein